MSEIETILSLEPGHPAGQEKDTFSLLRTRITVLNARSWEHKLQWREVQRWLDNFDGRSGHSADVEQLHSLFLLSQFMYYGSREVRVLLRSLYRELILVPIIQRARAAQGNTRDVARILPELENQLSRTRILGIGNPSESGTHLLYFFRQENALSKTSFMNATDIVKSERAADGSFHRSIRFPDVQDYYFIDDVCGSGDTAKKFSKDVLDEILAMANQAPVRFHYYCIFGTRKGLGEIRANTVFGENVAAIYELDETFSALSDKSRYLKNHPADIVPSIVREVALHYGALLWPGQPGGYDNNQLVLGFTHNTPDNTLPVFWGHPDHGSTIPWNSAFQRHWKYGY